LNIILLCSNANNVKLYCFFFFHFISSKHATMLLAKAHYGRDDVFFIVRHFKGRTPNQLSRRFSR
jgi:hypothetical protein